MNSGGERRWVGAIYGAGHIRSTPVMVVVEKAVTAPALLIYEGCPLSPLSDPYSASVRILKKQSFLITWISLYIYDVSADALGGQERAPGLSDLE